MYIRLVRFAFGPGKHAVAEELARTLVSAISGQPGCNSVSFFGDETNGEYGLVVFWDSQENADAAVQVIGPKMQQGMAGNAQSPPDIRLFEVMETKP